MLTYEWILCFINRLYILSTNPFIPNTQTHQQSRRKRLRLIM